MLTIFYDGNCPLCSAEMRSLKRHDQQNKIQLVDLHSDVFAQQYPEINVDAAMRILHANYNGQVLRGLQVTHRAWTLIGKGFWVAPLNWPVVKTISHWIYLLVARFRHPLSSILAKALNIKATNCHAKQCQPK